MLIINSVRTNCKIHYSIINGNMVLLDQERIKKVVLKTLADLIMIQAYAKIGMILDTVFLVIVVCIYMIEVIIKQVGNYRKIFKNQNDKDGNV
jgi:hypothetical protein